MSYGQNPWPPLGSSVGHERAGLLSVTGHVLLTVDSFSGSTTTNSGGLRVSTHPESRGVRPISF
jgi:hypothetical protein